MIIYVIIFKTLFNDTIFILICIANIGTPNPWFRGDSKFFLKMHLIGKRSGWLKTISK